MKIIYAYDTTKRWPFERVSQDSLNDTILWCSFILFTDPSSETLKLLKVLLNPTLNRKSHIEYLIGKLDKVVFQITKLIEIQHVLL